MAIKKFKCTVTREEVYTIEIDDEVWDATGLKAWSEVFDPSVTDLEDHAENIAILVSKHGESFLEGYGYVKFNGENQLFINDKDTQHSINVVIGEQDIRAEVQEIAE